jgi:ubiquinone/menaquinone biosynthesis C-methylase UbiE
VKPHQRRNQSLVYIEKNQAHPMAAIPHSFVDSIGYERLMGRWSRAVGSIFLEWVAPPSGARWLEVGCGTGIFTGLVLDAYSPASVFAIDPAEAQINHASHQSVAQRANFQVADAQALPFPDAAFDIIASALVINFIPDRPKALSEMRRVARAGGMVAGYVWDFSAEFSPSGPFRRGLRQFGVDVAALPGAKDSSLGALHSLFEQAGFESIATQSIEVTLPYADFDDFWQAQTTGYSPTTKTVAAMTISERERLMDTVRAELPVHPDGRIEYAARANAIKAVVPG